MAATMPTMPGMGGITVIDTPNLPNGPTYTTVYTDLCQFYWHPGVFLKIDNPKNNITNLNSFGDGCLLTTNRTIRSGTPSGGTNGWLISGSAGDLSNSIYLTYSSKKSNETVTHTYNTVWLNASGSAGNRQPNYPPEEKVVINKYPALAYPGSNTAQVVKYRRSYTHNQPIKGNYFSQAKWERFCHDYDMSTYSDVYVSYYGSQTEAVTIKRIQNRTPALTKAVLTVNTVPANATVTFSTTGTVYDHSILVDPNIQVTYTVSAPGYQSVQRSTYVTTLQSVEVTLTQSRSDSR